ncbi:MAG: hypothetical protein HY912_15905, partial [Desulfomonile tiedjei]|nr:hypothetical protein [Desulfomonile tiedjei]
MNLTIQSLAEICGTHVLTEKWLIAPSLRAGYQWLDSVARTGQPVVNAHVQTVGGLAIKLSKPRLRNKGLSRLTSQGAIILVDQILNRLVEQAPGYFTGSKPSLSLSQRIFYSIRDLRLAGLDESAVDPSLFEAMAKGQEIIRILESYAKELRDLKLADYADEIDLARESLADSPSALDGDVLVILPEDIDASITLKEKQLLESIPIQKKVALPVDSPESITQDRPLDNSRLLRWIREPSKAPNAGPDDGTVSIFSAVGEVNEVREVFRRCLAQKVPLDEVELLYTDRNAYVPLIYELAARLKHEFSSGEGTIATFEEGIPATYSRPGKALTAWTSWIREGFIQSTFVKILEEDVLVLPGEPTDVQRMLMVRLLRSAQIGLGEDRYLPPLESLVRRCDAKLKASEKSPDDDNGNSARERAMLENKACAAHSLKDIVKVLLALTVPQTLPSPVKTPSAVADA